MVDEVVPPVNTPAPSGTEPPVVPVPTPPEPPAGRFVPADRFDATVAQKYEAIRRAEAAEQRATELEARLAAAPLPTVPVGEAPPVPPAPRIPSSPTEADIAKLVREQTLIERFNEKCNEVAIAGRKANADFDASIAALRNMSPLRDASGAPMLPQPLVEAAIATGKGHEVLYSLGKDSSEADRIMSLTPVAQAVELAKLARKFEGDGGDDGASPPAGETETERVAREAAAVRANPSPEPIRPLARGRGAAKNPADMDISDPALPMEDFVKRRNAEEKARREARFA